MPRRERRPAADSEETPATAEPRAERTPRRPPPRMGPNGGIGHLDVPEFFPSQN
jgi:hypothetical protein